SHIPRSPGLQRRQALLEYDLGLALLPGCAAVDEGLRLPGGVQGRVQEGLARQVARGSLVGGHGLLYSRRTSRRDCEVFGECRWRKDAIAVTTPSAKLSARRDVAWPDERRVAPRIRGPDSEARGHSARFVGLALLHDRAAACDGLRVRGIRSPLG